MLMVQRQMIYLEKHFQWQLYWNDSLYFSFILEIGSFVSSKGTHISSYYLTFNFISNLANKYSKFLLLFLLYLQENSYLLVLF